jgi:hypothetical protein
MHQPRPKPRPKSKKKSKSTRIKKEPQPTEWTAEELQATWRTNRDIEYESIARKAGLDSMDMEAGRDQSEVSVEMVLKGLWKVDGEVVVEGECPVSIPYSLPSFSREIEKIEHGLMIGM